MIKERCTCLLKTGSKAVSVENLVIVESPAKAKTINKFLGSNYRVIASMGHVRDLSAKDGAVDPHNDFAMTWDSSGRSSKSMSEIISAAKTVNKIWLATDPDREGEAISWHILEILRNKLELADGQVHRITFNEITKSAIQRAVEMPRILNQELIDAYLARRALDFLVGFSLSPILWRKVPGSKSAGRVQSVALRLICERESEIEIFKSLEYWSVSGDFAASSPVSARLHQLDGKRLERHGISNASQAEAIAERARTGNYKVETVTAKQTRRNPPPPFITSSLQQDASRRLGFSATRTMRVAQNLYEGVTIGGTSVGLITYMRTDGVTMSAEAVRDVRNFISQDYGHAYLPTSPRTYKSVAKNAQEAHEAIRPTDVNLTPNTVRGALGDDEARLYDLIWRRTVACQMESAVLDQTTVDIAHQSDSLTFRATGSVIRFDGFQRVYQPQQKAEATSKDGETEGDDNRQLPAMEEGQTLLLNAITPQQHFTQPPPRYSEATLVRKLEELGIGRPSTYASTLQVLQDRDYVRLDSKRFIPEERGRIVVAFLLNFFGQYVEYDFTANLETQLDDITTGSVDWRDMLRDFWEPFHKAIDEASNLTLTDVIDALDVSLESYLFPTSEDDSENAQSSRLCPACGNGRLGLKLSRFGAFIGCSGYPECKHTRKFGIALGGNNGEEDFDGPYILGTDPATGGEVSIRKGPYGHYAQLDSPETPQIESSKDSSKPQKTSAKTKTKAKAPKPKRSSLLKDQDPATVTLETALALLSLPRNIDIHPEDGEMILAGLGRYGPYIKHGARYVSLKESDDVLSIGINRAVAVLAEAPMRQQRSSSAALRELGEHPTDGGAVTLHNGRYGPYAKHGKVMASLPKDQPVEDVTLDQAITLIAAKAAKSGSNTKAKKAKKSTSKRPAKKT